MGQSKSGTPYVRSWDRRPIGYEITPDGVYGWAAFLVREGDDEHGASAFVMASGRNRSRVCRRAERAVRGEQARFDHEHSGEGEVVIL